MNEEESSIQRPGGSKQDVSVPSSETADKGKPADVTKDVSPAESEGKPADIPKDVSSESEEKPVDIPKDVFPADISKDVSSTESEEKPSDIPKYISSPESEEKPVDIPKGVFVTDSDDQESENATFSIDDIVNMAGYGAFQKVLTFLAGLGWLADAFEVIILSIIGDMLACEWRMHRWQNALMTSVVFAGMAMGAPVFGNFADRFGRRTALAISMLFLFIFGAASAASPDYTWMVVLRGFMGFSLGGIAQGVTLCCEYYPAKIRGRAGFYLSYYWAIGTLGVIGSAWIIMQHMDNWRVFVFIAAVPALIVFLTMKWYPESARYYLVSNQPEKAMKTLRRVTKMNKVEMPKGKLIHVDAAEQRGKLQDLLKPKMRRTTLLFWYIWLAVACAYYGIALITPLIITDGSLLASSAKHANTTLAEDFTAIMPCKKFTNENFLHLFWTSAAELPGLLVFTVVVEYCSRKVFLGTTILITACLMLLLMLEIKPEFAIFLILFVVRGLVAGVFQLLFIMTTEAFPTTLRASAMGTGSGCARVGGLIIPYLAQVAVIAKPIVSMFVLCAVMALAGVAAFLLPLDTRGRNMQDAISSKEEEENVNNVSTEPEVIKS